MGRGKIEIKKIENHTNRQVTYSKRRSGLFKKARELTVLCDASISIIMFSHSNKLHEYTSPSTTTKEIYDRYQKAMDCDLWSSHYERMLQELKKQKDINARLSRDIRQRLGQDLTGLSFKEVVALEEKVSASVELVRERKFHVIKTHTDTTKKKVKNLEQRKENLHFNLFNLRSNSLEDPQHGVVENEGEDPYYGSAVALADGASNLYAYRLLNSHPSLHHGGGAYGFQDLRLA